MKKAEKIVLRKGYDENGNKVIFAKYPEGLIILKSLETFTDIVEHAKSLVDACWIPLENISDLKPSIIRNLLFAEFPEEELRLTGEIGLLGELATYPRSTIALVKGIGPKTLDIIENVLHSHNLDWETSMQAIRTLANDS